MIRKVKGFRDIYGSESKKFLYVEKIIKDMAISLGINFLILPVVEQEDLFKRCIEDGTDIVDKEMFTWDGLCLRPEFTSSFMRWVKDSGTSKGDYFYFDWAFRKENPQKLRFRQFCQFGIELLGKDNEYIIFIFLKKLFDKLNIKFILKVNNLGTQQEQKEYSKMLENYFTNYLDQLSHISKMRIKNRKFLRILDSKEDKKIIENAPKLNLSCNTYDLLDKLGIEYIIDSNLVRGLDYYNNFVFEIFSPDLNLALGGGGRYDNLFKKLYNQSLNAFGFAIGIDRLISLIPDIYINELKIYIYINNNYQFFDFWDNYILSKEFSINNAKKEFFKNNYNYFVIVEKNHTLSIIDVKKNFYNLDWSINLHQYFGNGLIKDQDSQEIFQE